MMSRITEILLGREKAKERQDVLSQLESSIEKGDRPKAVSALRKFLEIERQIGRATLTGMERFMETEKKLGKEIIEEKVRPRDEDEVMPDTTPSVFEPLVREKEKKERAKTRVDVIIRELEELKRVI